MMRSITSSPRYNVRYTRAHDDTSAAGYQRCRLEPRLGYHATGTRSIGIGCLPPITCLQYKDKAITGLTQGIEGLFKKNKVDYVKGHHRPCES